MEDRSVIHVLIYECLQVETSPKQWDTKQVLPINMTYLTCYFLWSFFHNTYVCIFAKTTALFNYKFIQEKSIVFTVSMKFCDQSDLAILKLQACSVKVQSSWTVKIKFILVQDLSILSTVSMKIYVNTLEQIKCLLIHWILFSIIFFSFFSAQYFPKQYFPTNILCSPVYLLIKSSYDNQYSSITISAIDLHQTAKVLCAELSTVKFDREEHILIVFD